MVNARVLILGALMVFVLLTPAWAQVTAQLNRTTVYEGDTVTLTLESDNASSSNPDLSPLEADFDVLGTGTGRQVQIINGRRSDTRQWHVTLRPKKMGTLRIPEIFMGSESTSALSMVVIDSMPSAQVAGQQMFLETKVENENVYLQQQIRFVVRLYYRLPLLEGQLSDPSVEGSVVQKLGDDKKMIIERDGVEYNVIERRYAIFPEKSGELHIPPLRFQGTVETPRSKQSQRRSSRGNMMEDFFGRDPFDDPFFGSARRTGESVGLKSDATTLTVKPQPSDYSADAWIPAASLSMEDSWVKDMPEFTQGEAVSRTVVIVAKGLTAPQLPDITLQVPDGFKVYPEKPVIETRTDGSWAYAISRVTASYVPVKSGLLDVPEQSISWWNTENAQQDVSKLTAWKVIVVANANPQEEQKELPAVVSSDVEDSKNDQQPPVNDEKLDQESSLYKRLGMAFFLFFFAGLVWWVLRARKEVKDSMVVSTSSPKEELRAALLELQRATSVNDRQASADALLALARVTWAEKPPVGLGALMEKTNQGEEEISRLDKALYGFGDESWEGAELWKVFSEGFEIVEEDKRKEKVLPPLYPQ